MAALLPTIGCDGSISSSTRKRLTSVVLVMPASEMFEQIRKSEITIVTDVALNDLMMCSFQWGGMGMKIGTALWVKVYFFAILARSA